MALFPLGSSVRVETCYATCAVDVGRTTQSHLRPPPPPPPIFIAHTSSCPYAVLPGFWFLRFIFLLRFSSRTVDLCARALPLLSIYIYFFFIVFLRPTLRCKRAATSLRFFSSLSTRSLFPDSSVAIEMSRRWLPR